MTRMTGHRSKDIALLLAESETLEVQLRYMTERLNSFTRYLVETANDPEQGGESSLDETPASGSSA